MDSRTSWGVRSILLWGTFHKKTLYILQYMKIIFQKVKRRRGKCVSFNQTFLKHSGKNLKAEGSKFSDSHMLIFTPNLTELCVWQNILSGLSFSHVLLYSSHVSCIVGNVTLRPFDETQRKVGVSLTMVGVSLVHNFSGAYLNFKGISHCNSWKHHLSWTRPPTVKPSEQHTHTH